MIIFENEGETDVRALTTFGVNVKEGEDPFGFFGTGFKYAIAILLRNGHRVIVQSGLESYEFTEHNISIRGKTFSIVKLNDQELSFTTDLGKTWQMWMAYRELYCNALDEGGISYEIESMPPARENMTRVIVDGRQFVNVHNQRSQFILTENPVYGNDDIELHKGESEAIFYRGIRVAKNNRLKSMFTMNLKRNMELTEDRTLSDLYSVRTRFAVLIKTCSDEDIIHKLLLSQETWDMEVDYDYGSSAMSPEFKNVLADLFKKRDPLMNESAATMARNMFGEDELKQFMVLSAVQDIMLRRAIAFVEHLGYPVKVYPILCVNHIGAGTLGMAKDGKIYLTANAFGYGTKTVAGTLIEEYIHLNKGHGDFSRAMQEELLNKIVSLGEELKGEPL